MTRLDRLILSEIVGRFFGGVLLFTGLFMSADTLLKILDYASSGVPTLLLIQLFFMAIPPIIAFTSPMAMLLATLLGFGRLSSDSEITAIFAAGASLQRVLAPVAAFAILVSLAGAYINDTVVPLSERGRQAIIDDQKRAKGIIPGSQIFNFRQTDEKGRVVMTIHSEGALTRLGGGRFRVEDVTAVYYQNGTPTQTIFAPAAEGADGSKFWQTPQGFRSYGVNSNGGTYFSSAEAGSTRPIELTTPQALTTAARPNVELTTPQLQDKARILRESNSLSDAREVEVEIARRYTVPFGSVVLALIGAPLGIAPRRSGGEAGFGYSVLITFIYWVTLQAASSLGRSGALPPLIAATLPNILGLIIAAYLIVRARR